MVYGGTRGGTLPSRNEAELSIDLHGKGNESEGVQAGLLRVCLSLEKNVRQKRKDILFFN